MKRVCNSCGAYDIDDSHACNKQATATFTNKPDDTAFDMVFRVCIYDATCRVFGNKRSDAVTYSADYGFRIWPWTNVSARIERIKKRMRWECEIVVKESVP